LSKEIVKQIIDDKFIKKRNDIDNSSERLSNTDEKVNNMVQNLKIRSSSKGFSHKKGSKSELPLTDRHHYNKL
jgi:hypothetical protein